MKLPQKLKNLRKGRGLSQLDLAEKLQVSRQAVSGWEAGASKPSTESLKSLGALYDVPLEYLLNDDASEPIPTDLEPNKEKSASDNKAKKKSRSIAMALTAIGIVVVVLYVIAILFWNKGEDPIPMEKIEGSDMVIVDDFEMDW